MAGMIRDDSGHARQDPRHVSGSPALAALILVKERPCQLSRGSAYALRLRRSVPTPKSPLQPSRAQVESSGVAVSEPLFPYSTTMLNWLV